MNSNIHYNTMASMKIDNSKLTSFDSILNFLRESSVPEVVSSTTTSSVVDSRKVNNQLKPTKKQKKEKDLTNLINNSPTNSKEIVERLPSGRVKYGPVTVNPRKQPSKTLFTGRRSKYEVLSGEEAERRHLRRERNRLAATKCREKRENILSDLELHYDNEKNSHAHLRQIVQQLGQRKQYLQSLISNHNCSLQQPSMVFGHANFLSTITETPAPPLPTDQLQLVANNEEELPVLLQSAVPLPTDLLQLVANNEEELPVLLQSAVPLPTDLLQLVANNEEEFTDFLQPAPILTNTAYHTDQSNYLFNTQQQQQLPQPMSMSASSLERMINSLHSPTAYIDNNNNNTCSGLYNSAYGASSTCAQQHSSSSEDDSLPPTHKNPFVC